MRAFGSIAEVGEALRGGVFAIGIFDGVHLGHRALIARAIERARARGVAASALTFEPHPVKVLAPALAPPLLTPTPRKLELLEAAGLDAVVLQPFDATFAAGPAGAFVRDALVQGLGASEVVVGYSFTFGRGREGDAAMLRRLGQQAGVAVHVIDPVACGGIPVSSTKIREFILEGRVRAAADLLGRPYDVDGEVAAGAGRGRGLGFATANLSTRAELLPAPGVYATWTRLEGRWVGSATNVGYNPTFPEDRLRNPEVRVEAHLFGVERDLYGLSLRVAFVERLRPERAFPSAESLARQIAEDVRATERVLAETPAPVER